MFDNVERFLTSAGQTAVRKRFRLNENATWTERLCKNITWYCNRAQIGFGDLRVSDILRIQKNLQPGEIFEGFTESQVHDSLVFEPYLTITNDFIKCRKWVGPVDSAFGDAVIALDTTNTVKDAISVLQKLEPKLSEREAEATIAAVRVERGQ